MKSFYSMGRQSLEQEITSFQGIAKTEYRAELLFRNIYKNQEFPPKNPFLGLAKDFVEMAATRWDFCSPVSIAEAIMSAADGSIKFAMELADGLRVESVLIPERGRLTQCLSTQVGCARACRFCCTGRMGLVRNLSTAEIVGQVLAAESWRKTADIPDYMRSYPRVTNLVFMGMGEPLDNLENVKESCKIFCDPHGFNFSPNKITVSTVGILPALDVLLQETTVAVAISLHSPFEEERSRVMPVNHDYPLTEVLSLLREHLRKGSRRAFMIQYTLLRGVNDSEKHAIALAERLQGMPVKINLIPLNEHRGAAFRRPDLLRVHTFRKHLQDAGFVATIRLSKGRDIAAACGQLIKEKVSLTPSLSESPL